MGLLKMNPIHHYYNLGAKLAAAQFSAGTTVGDPDNHNKRDMRRYQEKPDGKFQMADTRRPYRLPRDNQHSNDPTTNLYITAGGNLRDDFTGKKSRSGGYSNLHPIAKTFLP